MSLLFLLNGKLLIKNGALASSQSCCCTTCECPTGTYFCSCLDVDGMKIGSFPGTIGDVNPSGVDVECGPLGPNGENGWKITYNGADIFLTSSASGCCPINGTYTLSDNTTNITLYDPISPPCDDPEVKCLPKTWQLYDTTNQKVLDYGDIVPADPNNPNETNYILVNLETPFKPWGYYTKNFHVELRVYCEDDNVGEKIWETDVAIGSCGNNRYPSYEYSSPWTRKLCRYVGEKDPCLYDVNGDIITISMTPGGKTRSGRVNTYVGTVTGNYDYSNIFNWKIGGVIGGVRATYNNHLPDNSTNIEIQGSVLEDGSVGGAVCKDLTINAAATAQKEFGITINSYGRVLVTGAAHIIDEKYNTICSDPIGRGHIICNNTGSVSTIELSDGISYEYNGDIIFNGSYLSGTLEYTGTNKVAATFDFADTNNSKITDNATIIGGEHIFLNAANVEYINWGPSSLAIPEPEYEGKWIFRGGSVNFGKISTTQSGSYVRFFNSGANGYSNLAYTTSVVQGIVTTIDPVHFYDNSSNGGIVPDGGGYIQCGDYAIVTNNAVFHNNAWNSAKVGGNAEFYDNSSYFCGTITGTVDFYNTSYVIAGSTLTNDDIEFWDTSYNKGAITGDPIFHNNSYNDTNGTINGDPTFNNNSYNNGTINGVTMVTFNNYSQNRKTIVGDVTFNDESSIQDGTVNGNCSFVDNSYIWKGTVNGDCSFADYAGCGAYSPPPGGSWIYNGFSGPGQAIVNGNTTFANNTLNNGWIRVPNNGSCVFSDSSANDGGYITKADGVPGANNSPYSVIFNGTSRNGVSRITDVYGGNVTFNSGTGNGYPGVNAYVNAYNIVFNGTGLIGSVQNYGFVTGSNSVSMTNGYNNNGASMTGPTTLTNSENSTGATITGNTVFVSSKNYGTVTGDGDFDSTSCNSGTVTGAITCGGGACNPGDPPTC